MLKRGEYFGKFGKIVKVSVNRSGVYNSAHGGATGSACVPREKPYCARESELAYGSSRRNQGAPGTPSGRAEGPAAVAAAADVERG